MQVYYYSRKCLLHVFNVILFELRIFTDRNKVARVMFLHLCVCPQWGCLVWGGLLRGDAWSRGVCAWGGFCSGGGSAPGGCIPACTEADPPPQQTATVVDGTHPTGMHSCYSVKLICSFLKNASDGSKWEMRQPPVKSCLFHENVHENLAKNYVGTPPSWIWVPSQGNAGSATGVVFSNVLISTFHWKLLLRHEIGIFVLLLPTNEVWGKVIFSQACVSRILSTEGGLANTPPGRHPPPWADPPASTTGYSQQADGTHPTGMHSCLNLRINGV